MNPSPRPSLGPFLAGLALVLATAPARAQLTPLADLRETYAYAAFGSQEGGPITENPAVAFAHWESYPNPLAEYPPPSPPNPSGAAQAFAFQVSEFFPAAIYASGGSNGEWQGEMQGTYTAYSLGAFRFRVTSCLAYTLYTTVEPGDAGSTGHVELRSAAGGTVYERVTAGEHTLSGRLSPGDYELEGVSTVGSFASYTLGPTYSMTLIVGPCPGTLIARQPSDTVLACGDPMELSVIPTPPGTGLTYQWRFNGAPLVNGPRISGATGPTLTIDDACAADTGYYDVVVTAGTTVEPSRVAHVTLPGGTTDVPPVASTGPRVLTLGPATPNPSAGVSSFRYTARRPVVLGAAILDAAGRVVRTLEHRLVSGEGALTWDGRNAAGAPAAAGIYFLRVRADGESQVRRFVRMR